MLSPLRRSDPDFFEFEWVDFLTATRQPGRAYTATEIVRPLRDIGCYAVCSTAGVSGQREPVWGNAGETVRDGNGTLVWIMTAAPSLPSISAVTYTITPSTITQSLPTTIGTRTRVKLDASAAELGMYEVLAEITADGEDYSQSAIVVVID